MAYQVRKANYCYMSVPSRAGQAVKILNELKNAGVDLIAFSGFPAKAGKAQVDLVSDNIAGVRRVAKKNKWRLSKTRKGFVVQGTNEIGAVHKVLSRLAKENINVVAADAVAAGKGRFGMIFWVKPKYYAKAARLLNAR